MESFAVVFNDNLGFRPCNIGLKLIDPRHFASLGAQRDFAIEPGARKRISSSLLGKGKQEDDRGFHGRTRAIVGIFCRLGRFRDSGEPFCALAKAAIFATLVSGARLTRGFSSDSLMVKSPQNSQMMQTSSVNDNRGAIWMMVSSGEVMRCSGDIEQTEPNGSS